MKRLVAIIASVLMTANFPSAEADESLVSGISQFGLELWHRLADRDDNLALSPFSISTALAMAYAGARGVTAAQMASTLHISGTDRTHQAVGELLRQLGEAGNSKDGQLLIANALWLQKKFPRLTEFEELLRAHYAVRLRELDFESAPEQARAEINRWTEENTQERIKDLLKPGFIRADTRLVLTNAVYFRGKWSLPFAKDHTSPAPFTRATGSAIDVPMMSQTANFDYVEQASIQILEMRYGATGLAMTILLPKRKDGLRDLERSVSADQISRWLADLKSQNVMAGIPRFHVESDFSLAGTLRDMGMADAFTERADFSGMDGRHDLYLTAVVHKAFVEIDEQGAEAAAATGVVAGLVSTPVSPPPLFLADHPFLFLIRDRRTGCILFIGRVTDPSRRP